MLADLTVARTEITAGFETWLLNSVAVLLIIATEMMGMMAGNTRVQPAGGVKPKPTLRTRAP